MDNIEKLARAFAEQLRADIGDAAFEAVKRLNATPQFKDTGACASHNYCDANMTMAEAFETAMGRDVFTGDHILDADMDLWNAAWNFARTTGLVENGRV